MRNLRTVPKGQSVKFRICQNTGRACPYFAHTPPPQNTSKLGNCLNVTDTCSIASKKGKVKVKYLINVSGTTGKTALYNNPCTDTSIESMKTHLVNGTPFLDESARSLSAGRYGRTTNLRLQNIGKERGSPQVKSMSKALRNTGRCLVGVVLFARLDFPLFAGTLPSRQRPGPCPRSRDV